MDPLARIDRGAGKRRANQRAMAGRTVPAASWFRRCCCATNPGHKRLCRRSIPKIPGTICFPVCVVFQRAWPPRQTGATNSRHDLCYEVALQPIWRFRGRIHHIFDAIAGIRPPRGPPSPARHGPVTGAPPRWRVVSRLNAAADSHGLRVARLDNGDFHRIVPRAMPPAGKPAVGDDTGSLLAAAPGPAEPNDPPPVERRHHARASARSRSQR